MKPDAMYGGALIAGTLGSFLTMAMHPTGSRLLVDVQNMALLAMTIGHLRLDAHGFGAVVLTQGIWMITAGVLLIRAQELPSTA